MKYAAAPSVASSTAPMASPSVSPSGRRPSTSTVNETAHGTPTSVAARTIPIARDAQTGTVNTAHVDTLLGGEVNFYRFEVPPGSEVRGEMVVEGLAEATGQPLFCPLIYLTDEGDGTTAPPENYSGGPADETYIRNTKPVELDTGAVWLKIVTDGCSSRNAPDAEFDVEFQLTVIE